MDTYDTAQALSDLSNNTFARVITIVIIVFVLQYIIHSMIERVVRRAVTSDRFETRLDEIKREDTLITIIRTASSVLIWLFAVIIILWEFDVNIGALATGAGLIGIIVGFGAQSAIKDFLAGIFIIAENQYRVGDIVELRADGGKVAGYVEDITIRISRLRDLDGILHTIPNGSIQMVSNLSFHYANVNIDINVAYSSDIDHVEKVINDVGKNMLGDEQWGKHIIEPIQFLRVESFEDSAVQVKALGKVEPAQQWDVASLFRRNLKVAFEKEGISIPYPQIVVHTPPQKSKTVKGTR
jgi:moderate conductance mechanosensitive channel